ncbi:MAG: hypothetical protein Kow0029_01220 [Candidatus Rifleibacteriota bacterium]
MIFLALFSFLIFTGCGGISSSTSISAGDSATQKNLDYGRIQGTITASSTGNIIAGAIVETHEAQAISGDDGRYLLGPIPPGDYRVIARASGYSPVIKDSVRVLPGKITENQNFSLSTTAASFDPEFAIIAVLPNIGTDGDRVYIYCRGCGSQAGKVTFNGKEAQILDWNSKSDDRILVQVPAEVETGPVKVIINGQESKETQAQIFTGKPYVLSATPTTAQGNQIITLYGRNFNQIAQFNKVKVAGLQCTTISVANSSTMQIQLPQIAKTGLLTIRIESNEYQIDGFSSVTITIRPELVHISPRRSIPGVPITLYGYNFGDDKSLAKVLFGGHIIQPGDFITFSDTRLSFAAPDNTVLAPDKTAEVIVQINDSKSNSLSYTAYNTINNTLTDYGIYDFNSVSAGGTLHLPCLKPTDRIVFLNVLSGDGALDLDGDYAFNVSAFLGGNFTLVPNLPGSIRETTVFDPDFTAMQSGKRIPARNSIRAALGEPASDTIEVYLRDFTSSNPWDTANDILATGTVQATTSVSLVYFDITSTGLDKEAAILIAAGFDNIYNTLATACWDGVSDPPEGNIDEQKRIALFVSPLLDRSNGAEKIAAYFDVRDKDPAAIHSMGTEIIYANGEVYKSNKSDFYGGLAQTLSFMIYNNQKGLEGTNWQDYGISTWARQEAGYGFIQGDTRSINWVSQYLQYPEQVSLNHWPESPAYYHYGMAFLFTQYLFDRCGGYNAIRVLEKMNGAKGLIDIDNNIIRAGMANPPSVSFREFFHDFCLALFCDDLGLPDGFPGYNKDSYQFKSIQLHGKYTGIEGLRGLAFNENPVHNSTMSVKGYGCRMFEYPTGNWGDLEVTINSTPTTGDFKTWVIYYSAE